MDELLYCWGLVLDDIAKWLNCCIVGALCLVILLNG